MEVLRKRGKQPHGARLGTMAQRPRRVDDQRAVPDIAPAQPTHLLRAQCGVGDYGDRDGVAIAPELPPPTIATTGASGR